MEKSKTIRLVDLERPVGDVELPSGRTVDVMPITGKGMQIRQSLIDGTATDPDIWEFARVMMPTATEEEVQSLSPTMVQIIATISSGHLDKVLAMAKAMDEKEGKAPAPIPTEPSSTRATG